MLRRGWIPVGLFHMQECPQLGNVPVKCKTNTLFWRLMQADKSLGLLTNNYKRGSDKGCLSPAWGQEFAGFFMLNPIQMLLPALVINNSDVLVFSTSLTVSNMGKPLESST